VRLAVNSLALVVAFTAIARADWPIGTNLRIVQLQLDGAFAPDRQSARAGGADAVLVRVAGTERWFGAVRARTVGNDPTLFGRDVLAAVAPVQPNLIALGPDALTQRLAGAADGAAIHMEGIVDIGARTYLLRHVKLADAPP